MNKTKQTEFTPLICTTPLAYQYANGVVQINEMRYMGYSITDAIRKYRQSNK